MATQPDNSNGSARKRITRPYPQLALEEALTIARTIQESNSGLSCDRVLLAKALGTTPASSRFFNLLTSSVKYGLTEGGYKDTSINLTDRGMSIVSPKSIEEQAAGLLNAAIEPDVFRSFYTKLSGNRLPEESFSLDLLEKDFSVPKRVTEECLSVIVENGLMVGVLVDVEGSLYVRLPQELESKANDKQLGTFWKQPELQIKMPAELPTVPNTDEPILNKVLIGHAGNSDIVEQLKEIVEPFGISYEIVESDYDATRPLSEDVSIKMRECSAAILIIVPSSDQSWKGRREDKRTQKLSYMLGAASALYGDRLLVLMESSSEVSNDIVSEVVEVQDDRPGEMGFRLLAQLHRMGVIRVSS